MIYDLTHTVNADTPVYPGDPKVVIEAASQFATAGCLDHTLKCGSHTGTHIDAPAHMIEGGKQLKDFPVERFVVSATCIDARQGFDAATIAKVAQKGDALLFYTGASDRFHDSSYYQDYAVLNETAIAAIIAVGVSMVGLDTGSADTDETFPVHKTLLGADILILENLTNFAELVGKRFMLHALPLKLESDGAPVRAVAEL